MSREFHENDREYDPSEDEPEPPGSTRELPLWAQIAIGGFCGALAAIIPAYMYIGLADWHLNAFEPALREFLDTAPTYSSRLAEALAANDRWVISNPQEVVRNFVIGGGLTGAVGSGIYSRFSRGKNINKKQEVSS